MVTLESAKQAFEIWRANKPSINTPTPVELWDMVEHLLPNYKRGEIYKALGISCRQIQTNCRLGSIAKNQIATPPEVFSDFVEATPPPLNVGLAELTLKGDSKSLHLCLPVTALGNVLPMLGALL